MKDRNLTDHFTLFELTKTNHPALQEQNRDLSPIQITKLTALARLLEHVRFVLGTPLTIHSGYRCPEVNKAAGSSDRSQHLLCEAADFVPGQQDLGFAFRTLWKDVLERGANVGQLIHETAYRPYGVTSWIHISLGVPYRDEDRCKQILRMENGIYTRLDNSKKENTNEKDT